MDVLELPELLANERLGLADVLAVLTPDQWESPSLSEGWTVRHVVAHLVMPFRYSLPRVALKLVRAGGNFNRMADRVARQDASLPTAELVATLRENARHDFTPPGAGYEAPLTDLVVHGLDICRPLAIERPIPADTTRLVLDNVVTDQSLKFFGTDLSGVELHASDMEWTFGSGEPVVGSSSDLILAVCGRPAGSERLVGAGAHLLAERLVPSS
ncbi:MAG: hypothetical protein QOJ44_1930 [Acidimicrobiaceae bacterium]|jgi:uncharacterized protein (TIGR03083 family)|nr:hypothetical protein [Acidimicrobiaceae bacterium]